MIPAAAVALLGLAAELLPAQGYDPRYEWRTIETPHFRVHHHQGLGPLAQRTARACERAWSALVPLVARAPGTPVHVVLSDDVDDSNGSATAQPRNLIRLYGVPPLSGSELADHGDWLEMLVTHELVHVVHLDAVGGLPAMVNALFGKLLAPAGLGPPWLTEGLAVLHESGPGAGRAQSSLFGAWSRALAGERLPRLDQVSSQPLDWPGGNLWYLLGGRFLAYLQERAGPEALRAFAEEQGEQVWPYFMSSLAERHLGASFDELWAAFGESLRARARAEVEAASARPLTRPALLTRRGGALQGPRFAPDGQSLWFVEASQDEAQALRQVDLQGRPLGTVPRVLGNGSFALVDGRQALASLTDAFEEYRSVDDLYLLDLASGARQRLTFGERATDPDVAPGGGWAVYVARLPGGEQELRRLRLEGGAPETLLHRPGAQLFLPRISPDGKRIALEIQEGGRRDIALLQEGRLDFLTRDDALDQAPAWAPDGRSLYFSSDRGGIYNVHRLRLDACPADGATACAGAPPAAAGALRQVTNVADAALQPAVAPDERHLAWLTVDARGYQLALAPLDPAAGLEPLDPGLRPAHRAPPPPEEPPLPSRPYSAWETLGPTWWLPTLSSDASGTTLGALTAGGDVVGRHAWGLAVSYGLRSREPAYDAAWVGGFLHPQLALASGRSFGVAPDGRDEVAWVPLDASLSWTRSHEDRSHAVALGWRALLLRPQGTPDPGAEPYRGATASELVLGAAYGSRLRFVRSISAEEGGLLSLRVRVATPDLGGDQRYASARLSASGYLRLPGTRHVVLALHGSLGGSSGTLAGRAPFALGGVATADLLGLVEGLAGGGFPSPSDQLRGYPAGAFSGPTLVSTSTELRFPLLSPLRGYSTWPLFLRRIHGALFLDAGAVFGARDGSMGRRLGSADLLRFGAGGELRMEVVLGYYLRTDLRLGVARGLGPLLAPSPVPRDPLRTTQVYLGLGESF